MYNSVWWFFEELSGMKLVWKGAEFLYKPLLDILCKRSVKGTAAEHCEIRGGNDDIHQGRTDGFLNTVQ